MDSNLYRLIEETPVIAAIKDDTGLLKCCENNNINIVFILYGDVCNIASIVEKVKSSGKIAMVHLDLVSGLSNREVVVDFIKTNTLADGVISTRPSLLKRAKELSLYTTLRVFVLDSLAYDNIDKQLKLARPDIMEILPGLMPKVISKITNRTKVPVIAGGLISDKEDIVAALSAGAIAVSTTNENVWNM